MQAGFCFPANQRVTRKDSNRFVDEVHYLERGRSLLPGQKIADTFKIDDCLACIAYFCHGLASGRCTSESVSLVRR